MKSKNKVIWGIILTTLGGFGIIFASSLGFTLLARLWSFVTGFITGVLVSLGVGLLISGLVEIKRIR